MKSKSSIHFDEQTTRAFFPGAFEIIDYTNNWIQSYAEPIANNQKLGITTNAEWSILGILGSHLILLGHTYGIIIEI